MMKLKKLLKFARERSWSIKIDGDGCTEVFDAYNYKIGEGATPKQAVERSITSSSIFGFPAHAWGNSNSTSRPKRDDCQTEASFLDLEEELYRATMENKEASENIQKLISALEKYRGQVNRYGNDTAADDISKFRP